MIDAFRLELPLWEIILRAVVVYVAIAVALRVIPKRQTGNVSPNDLIALIIVGALAADAIIGDATTITDIFLMTVVVLLLDYASNLLEYRFPRFRRVAQDTSTLLIHNGQLLKNNLRREQLTEQELAAALRKHGITDIERVRQAVLEVDGQVSVIERDPKQDAAPSAPADPN